jgi:hypothetical protein
MRRIDHTGRRYGRLFVEKIDPERYGRWICLCDCGTRKSIGAKSLGRSTRSCGCLSRELTSKRNATHGHSRGYRRSPTFAIWHQMRARCENRKSEKFPRYGGRGIVVCERWKRFENFLADMGERPPKMSIERIDNDGPYSPENCRWATSMEQGSNTSTNRLLTVRGVTLHLTEWSRRMGVRHQLISRRLQRGWSEEAAVLTPSRAISSSPLPRL